MKIGFVLDDSLDKTDGVQQYVLTLGRWLKSVGHDVHYLVGDTKRTDVANIHSLSRNLPVRFNGNQMSTPLPAPKRRIKELLDTEKFDILHVQIPFSPFMAGRIIQLLPERTALVGTFHIVPKSPLESSVSVLLGMVTRRSLKQFQKIISVSQPAADFAKQRFSVQSTVLPNLVDMTQFGRGKKISSLADNKLTIVFLGRLVRRKGCQELLRSISYLQKHYDTSNVRILICGTGPLERSLKDYVSKQRLDKIVEFSGYIKEVDKPDYLASADIAVFPSLGGESFGIVLIEAMAAGQAVVIGGQNSGYASVLGAWPQCLVDPKNTKDFAERINNLLNDKSLRRSLRSSQQQTIKRYDVGTIGPKILQEYKSAIAKKLDYRDN